MKLTAEGVRVFQELGGTGRSTPSSELTNAKAMVKNINNWTCKNYGILHNVQQLPNKSKDLVMAGATANEELDEELELD